MSDLAEISDIENTSLPAHTAICAQRYKQVDLRLISLEGKMDAIQQDILEGQKSLKATLITTGGSIVIALIGVIGAIVTKF